MTQILKDSEEIHLGGRVICRLSLLAYTDVGSMRARKCALIGKRNA